MKKPTPVLITGQFEAVIPRPEAARLLRRLRRCRENVHLLRDPVGLRAFAIPGFFLTLR